MKSYISAIRAVLFNVGVKLDMDEFLLVSLTKACRLKNDRVRTRLPIQKGLLTLILKQVKLKYEKAGQPYLSLLFQTMLSTAYFGLLRVSEVISSSMGSHPVLARDVHIGRNKNKMLFLLRTSKTHNQGSHLQMIKITSSSQTRKTKLKKWKGELVMPCPFQLLKNFAEQCGPCQNLNDPFFIFHNGSAVSPWRIRNCLKTALTDAGFDNKLYGFHSLRIGRMIDLLKLGLSVETIKKIGQWKSKAVFRYLR